MTLDDIADILGPNIVAQVHVAIKAAFVAALRHPDRPAAEAALDRLLMALASAVIAHPGGLDGAAARAEACCRDLQAIVAEARRLAAEEPAAAPPGPALKRAGGRRAGRRLN